MRAIALDKTGTLTIGEPRVTDLIPLGDRDPQDVLALAAAVESQSEHPLAEAVVAYAREQKVEIAPATGFEALVGNGARATVNGQEVWIGSPRLFEELAPTAWLPDEVAPLQDEGKTVVLVGQGAEPLGLLALRDEPRQNAAAALAAIKRAGISHVVMLTGDNQRTAHAIADALGIEYEAELKPEDKVAAIERLRERYGPIAMIGDGINDAPALATADVGIAMGTGGTDAAIEAADVALMGDDLTKVAEALRLGRRAVRISRQNLVFSVVLLAILIPSAVLGLLAVVGAVLVHEVSELLAVANGVRAARGKVATA